MSLGPYTLAIAGPGDDLSTNWSEVFDRHGWRVGRIEAGEGLLVSLVDLAPDALLLGPIEASPAPWESEWLRAARDRRIPVIPFGSDATGLARLVSREDVIGVLPSIETAEGAALLVAAALSRHRRELVRQDDLETQLALASAILDEAPLAIYAKDPNMRFLLSNNRHAELTGRTRAEILGQTDVDLFGESGVSPDATGRGVYQSGQPTTSEFELDVHDSRRIFQETIFPIRLRGGRRIGIAGIATDLTDMRQKTGQLKTQVDELGQVQHVSSLTSECVDLVQRCVSLDEGMELITRYLFLMYPEANLAFYEQPEGTVDLLLRRQERRFGTFSPTDVLETQDCWGVRTRRVYAFSPGGPRVACRHVTTRGNVCMCVPLISMDRVLGLMTLELSSGEEASAPDEERVKRWVAQLRTTMQSLAGALSTVSLRESLHRLTLSDELTGLPNERAFVAAAQKSVARTKRTREALVLAVFDVRELGQYSEVWGIDEASRIMRSVADVAVSFFRAEDFIARLGTETFGAILSMRVAADAEPRLEAFRTAVRRQCRAAQGPVEIAIGFGIREPDQTTSIEELMEYARSALLEARQEGSEQVRRGGPTGPAGLLPVEMVKTSAPAS